MESEEKEKLRVANPEFAKLVDIINGTYLEDGLPATILSEQKGAEMQLCSSQEQYLQHLLLAEELCKVVRTRGEATSPSGITSEGVASARERSGDLLCSAAQLNHSLGIGPEATVLGLLPDHLRGVASECGADSKVSNEVMVVLERSLTEKCQRVVQWHTPKKDGHLSTDSSPLVLAKMQQLPRLLSQQREEMEQFEREKKESQKRCRETRARGILVLSEMCKEMKLSLEKTKLELCAWSSDASLSYMQAEMHALIGKLEMIHCQLLQGMCADGRLQSLTEIRSHLLKERERLTQDLSQTRQVIRSYEALGEEFLKLSQRYHEIKEEIENKQWALAELTKSMA